MEILDKHFEDPNEPNEQDRQWAAAAHALGLLGLFTFWFAVVATAIFYFLCLSKHPFTRRHAAAAFNFQFSILIYAFLLVIPIVFFTGMGFLALFSGQDTAVPTLFGAAGAFFFGSIFIAFWNFIILILCIIGIVRAWAKETWIYPLTFPLVA